MYTSMASINLRTHRPKVVAVLVDGPFATQDRHGEEVPEWVVCLMDADDCEQHVIVCDTYGAAVETGRHLAREHRLELIVEATRD